MEAPSILFIGPSRPKFPAILWLSLCALAGLAGHRAAAAETKVQEAVDQAIAEKGSARVIIVTRPDPEAIAGGLSMVAPYAYVAQTLRSDAKRVRPIGALRAVVTTVSKADLGRLRDDPNVEAVFTDLLVPPTTHMTIKLIGADKVHAKGFRGSDRVVAVLDTGFDVTHPALQDAIVGEACFSTKRESDPLATSLCRNGEDVDLTPGASGNCPATIGSCDHGTHVAGIIVGRSRTIKGSTYGGVSPAARVLAVQVFTKFSDAATCQGPTPCVLSYTSDQLRALEWVFRNRERYKVAAVNMSLGGGYFDKPCDKDSALTEIIDRLRSNGILTVISAGNDGFYDGVSTPACISRAVAVAASKKTGPIDTSYSNVSPYVDIVAPGTEVLSTVFGHSYAPKTGTSMAAPHVAGAIALLREEYPNATADELENRLKKGAPMLVDNRTGTPLPSLEIARSLPLGTGTAAVGAEAALPAPEDPLAQSSFIIKTTGPGQQVANSVSSTCGSSCELKRISDTAWKLEVPANSKLGKGKSVLTSGDLKSLIDALPLGSKVYSNTLSASHR